ncbi:MAG: ferredoxin [bacterium]|jgi:ferredoxin
MAKKVRIVPGCISCGTCEAICPAVFVVEGTARVHNHGAVASHSEAVDEAAEMCPVSVIEVTESSDKE